METRFQPPKTDTRKIDRWDLKGARPKSGISAQSPARARGAIARGKPKAIPAPKPEKPAPAPPPPILMVAPKEEEFAPPVSAGADELRPGGVAVLALKHHECKWPIGDPRLPGFHFCCAPRIEGAPYCQHHLYERAAEPGTRVGWWKPGRKRA